MSEHFKDEPISPAVAEQQIPHSGTLPENLREQPVRDFDKTTLPEAFEQGRLVTPDSPAPLIERREVKKSKKGLVVGLGAGAAGIAIAAGAVFGVNALNQAPRTEPTAAASADPSETSSGVQRANTPDAGGETESLTIDKLEIPAGLDADTLGKTIVADRWSQWINAGAVDGLADVKFDANESWDVLLPKVADRNQKALADALYAPGWESNDNLRADVDMLKSANLSTLKWYVTTAWSSAEKPQNKEAFRSWLTVQSVQELEDHVDETRTIEVKYSNNTNSAKNEGPAPDAGGILTITTKEVDGKEKITEVHVRSDS